MYNLLIVRGWCCQMVMCVLGIMVAFSAEAAQDVKSVLLKNVTYPAQREYPLSTQVKACDDFYHHVCDAMVSRFILPEQKSMHIFAFADHSERMHHARGNFLQVLLQAKPIRPRRKALKNFFQACLNQAAAMKEEQQIVKHMQARLNELKTHQAFFEFLAAQFINPYTRLVNIFPWANQVDPDKYDLIIDLDILSLPHPGFYQQPMIIDDLMKIMQLFFKILGMDAADKRARTMITFERHLAQFMVAPAAKRKHLAADTSVARTDLASKYANLGLTTLLRQIPASTSVRLLSPELMQQAQTLFDKVPLIALKSIYLYHTLSKIIDDAYPDFFTALFEFKAKHLGGPRIRLTRLNRCTKEMVQQFGFEIDFELLPYLFPDDQYRDQQIQIDQLVSTVRSTLVSLLKTNGWLSASAKNQALRKIDNMTLLLIKPQQTRNWPFNPPLKYVADKAFQNRFLLSQTRAKIAMMILSRQRNRTQWRKPPLSVNATYNVVDNTFSLYQGILQPPFFTANAPVYQNLASLGAIIGHELGHAIDDLGSRYDADGKLHPWFSAQDEKQFQQKVQPLSDLFTQAQYNSELTLGENINDWLGLTLAYRAAFPDQQGTQQQQQAFFRQYAKTWCFAARPAYQQRHRLTNAHALGDARTNLQVMQQPGFYRAFQCQRGDRMYLAPERRMKLW